MRIFATLLMTSALLGCASPTEVRIRDRDFHDSPRRYELRICAAFGRTCEEITPDNLPTDCRFEERFDAEGSQIGVLRDEPYLFVATARRPDDCALLGMACAVVDGASRDAIELTLERTAGACPVGLVCYGGGYCTEDIEYDAAIDAGMGDANVIDAMSVDSGDAGRAPDTSPPSDAGCADCEIIDVAAGGAHSCAVRADGRVYCWGDNEVGQVGAPTSVPRAEEPRLVDGLEGFVAVDVELGARFSCARGVSGDVRCWGDGSRGQLGDSGPIPSVRYQAVQVDGLVDARELALGYAHACARRDTDLVCWGNNTSGELGRGTGETRVTIASPGAVMEVGATLTVAGGDGPTCAVVAPSGSLRCWGWNREGAVGTNEATASYALPQVVVAPLAGLAVSRVTVGGVDDLYGTIHAAHGCAIAEGNTYCWGRNEHGQVGNAARSVGVLVPVRVDSGHVFTAIAAGGHHTCAVRDDARLFCWGDNARGQLGSTPAADPDVLQPGRVDSVPSSVDQAATGWRHTCVRSSGRVYCFGDDDDGQLGDGTSGGFEPTPVEVVLPR